jgi:ribosome biogenesis protein Tsr3
MKKNNNNSESFHRDEVECIFSDAHDCDARKQTKKQTKKKMRAHRVTSSQRSSLLLLSAEALEKRRRRGAFISPRSNQQPLFLTSLDASLDEN